jgi:hypothetical protein
LPNMPDPPPGVRPEPSSRGGIAALGGSPVDASTPRSQATGWASVHVPSDPRSRAACTAPRVA